MTADQIKSLIATFPELDVAKPPPATTPADPKPKPDPAAPKGKLTGPAWPTSEKTLDQILAGGKDAITLVIDQITENDTGSAYKPRYVLHCLATYTVRNKRDQDRATLIDALIQGIHSDKPKIIRADLIRTLESCGRPTDAAALAPLLTDEDLTDPAARAMVSLGGDAAKLLREAEPRALTPRAKLAILQALGLLNDPASVDTLLPFATDPDEPTRLTALRSPLARTADPRAAAPILKALDTDQPTARRQTIKSAFLLAESLANNNKKYDAQRIYEYLAQSCIADHESHFQDAAKQLLAQTRKR